VRTDQDYTTPLSITSQFLFCGLPLRMDTYRGCGFQCGFCFARGRGGNAPVPAVAPADPRFIARQFDRALKGDSPVSLVGEFLRHRVPVHFGGMSDPFQHAELRYRVTEAALKVLADHDYPTVISTRGLLAATEPYLSLLRRFRAVVVQFSMSSSRESTARRAEPRSHPPSDMLRCMEHLAKQNIPVTCRWQPYIPDVSEKPSEFAKRLSSSGCAHISLEHLKVPMEKNSLNWRDFTNRLGTDLHQRYLSQGALRDGREYVLPAARKFALVQEAAAAVREHGMTFGAADNEFQYMSDTACCCSGVDRFPGFENFFKHQIGYALRRCRGKRITYSAIQNEWTPQGSIDRYLNSHSRLSQRNQDSGTIDRHIQAKWNRPGHPGSPSSFFGVGPSGEDETGMMTYQWSDLAASTAGPARDM
jgi:DNA repair photolyase